MTAGEIERIWFSPQRFWAATRGMDTGQVEQLTNSVLQMAEKRELAALRQFDFIFVGNPYRRKVENPSAKKKDRMAS
jgi:hypothetical protein